MAGHRMRKYFQAARPAKKGSILVAIFMAALPAFAQDDDIDWGPFCETVEILADTSMTARQRGASLGDLLDHIENSALQPYFKDIGRELAMDAYGITRYGSEAHQQSAIVDFKSEALLACLRQVN